MSNAINDMREKVAEINELQQNVMKLFKLIEELQSIIQSQNELLDSIENNMKQVNEYLEEGVKNLEKAKEEYMSAQEKFCCIFFVMLVISIIGLNHFLGKMNIF
jgi:t-SNARE complex subunit (syntaxin)